MNPFRIGVLASGGGSNLQSLIDHIRSGELNVRLEFVLSNNSTSAALEKARTFGAAAYHVSAFTEGGEPGVEKRLLALIKEHGIDLLVLAGYMKKMPSSVLRALPNRVVNIHPALLPAFGGEGFYGARIHEAVVREKCSYTGVTIHLVNEIYDEGQILWQVKVPVEPGASAEAVGRAVLAQEHACYWKVVRAFAEGVVQPGVVAGQPVDVGGLVQFMRGLQ